ncbi:3-oxosteroid 1-dehydrogenase [Mycolicibacterium hassiacum DSM 44199]|uniref:3-oxosteroid 1-dehydrogenase n=1 Tax=Mycolicibacterium hassiacum (strain DSM 44199 / CIP 105218 / JCM 12690 / 3849) TaxID=1122247 RepID=K5BK07_MYCHD|nr:3-ketosteroid-delta-1-dehydrogenase [Mycolicibacterium hassiacum]EKF24034.1 3-oxosteroid 1-dehydrogenase [Mycolicibacterium hassiacum DSM 44199]MBX5485362.1 3-ketosteroid-delta-1-dehydrogenase [Mycolicibacterium hassiacum]MDA4086285.1 3-ketosteroid-delta-1-dehydrogenase [Mycolicibacterium hassiacum DSM 44199]PZN24268.1 MAG: 3-ketosteroid-delta-1-dehydrogenase [Mycolicibacterium hassiacum]VCT90771.1 3-oxosteroid 1-dehydrogenase [Mycolicibacterium hassiacum DSM 44199]
MTDPQHLTVDLLVVGSGTGMAAALAAHELGLSTLIVEKTAYVGGSTARSGGAFWMPANPILAESGSDDTLQAGHTYIDAVVGDAAPLDRAHAFVDFGAATIDMLRRTTPLKFLWAKDYADYHPERPGGSAVGRTCESRPFNTAVLGPELARLRPGVMKSSFPMPVTGADYRWLNLMARVPRKAWPRILLRAFQGIGGLALRRRYAAGGQALAAGMYAGVLRAGIPVWTESPVVELVTDGDRVTGAVVDRAGTRVTVRADRGVVLAAGGFDHDMAWRHKFQSESLPDHASLGAEGNTGDAIRLAQETCGAAVGLMDQAWWFPAFAPLPGGEPTVMLAERSLPGCLMVDQTGRRFINEAMDYMSFGQRLLERERAGDRVERMWMVFDQRYRNSYVMAAELFPRMPIPQTWYDAGIAHRADDFRDLAGAIGVPADALVATVDRFNAMARSGVDTEFGRGTSAYDRYYGDPTVRPNPNLGPLESGPFYAVRVVLSDLGTCGGLRADARARVLREDGSVVPGLYAIGNTAANAFGASYPGAGATIGQGLVFGYIAAHHAAGRLG